MGRRGLFSLAVFLPVVVGCGWWVRIAEVSGKVTVDGRPAKGVRVVFEPEARNGTRALASTDAAGIYRLTRLGPGNKPGTPVGKYLVKVLGDADDPEAPKVPARYGTASTLNVEVVAGKPNVFDIDIQSN